MTSTHRTSKKVFFWPKNYDYSVIERQNAQVSSILLIPLSGVGVKKNPVGFQRL
jgi:hypothetical protein